MRVEGVVHGPVKDTGATLEVLARGAFDAVVGIPVQVLGLARSATDDGVEVAVDSVLLSTDHAARSLAGAVESAWGCRVFDHYGTTEMGLGGGVECEARSGYHLREADLLFEIVDRETGAPVPDGAYGEIVFTTLSREAMPLIRYRTGDRGRFLVEPCACGSVLRRLERVRARFCGRARLQAGGMLDLAAVDEAAFALPQVRDVRAALRREAGRDVLEVEVQGRGGDALRCRVAAALTAAPGLAEAVRSDRLRLAVAVGTEPWRRSNGTAKRTLELTDESVEVVT